MGCLKDSPEQQGVGGRRTSHALCTLRELFLYMHLKYLPATSAVDGAATVRAIGTPNGITPLRLGCGGCSDERTRELVLMGASAAEGPGTKAQGADAAAVGECEHSTAAAPSTPSASPTPLTGTATTASGAPLRLGAAATAAAELEDAAPAAPFLSGGLKAPGGLNVDEGAWDLLMPSTAQHSTPHHARPPYLQHGFIRITSSRVQLSPL